MTDLNEDQGATLNKKIRSAQLAQYNYIFGKDEWLKMKTDYFIVRFLLHLHPFLQCC